MTSISATRSSSLPMVAQAIGLSLVIAASAHIKVPFWPVPMTLQTLSVLAIAAIFGWRVGVGAMAAYLVEGALGLPVFASGIGPAVLVGPTAGYLLGMLAGAGIVGSVRGAWRQAAAIGVASVLTIVLGAAWLSQFVGVDKAVSLGVVPFLLGDVVKGGLAWALARVIRR